MVAGADPADMNASDRSTHMDAAKATNMRAAAEAAHMAAATKSAAMPAATTATATRVGGNGQKARSKKGVARIVITRFIISLLRSVASTRNSASGATPKLLIDQR
jgi:hypothetical protein